MGRLNKPPPDANWVCRLLWLIPFPLRPGVEDLLFRIEKAFGGVKLQANDFPWRAVELDADDFTAGQLHDWICDQLRANGRPVPTSSWHRVQRMLVNETGVAPRLVRPTSYVQRDLGFFEGG